MYVPHHHPPPRTLTPHDKHTTQPTKTKQGAYLLACDMVATLLDIVALSPMLLGRWGSLFLPPLPCLPVFGRWMIHVVCVLIIITSTRTIIYNNSLDQGAVLAQRGVARRHHSRALLAHAQGGLGPLPPGAGAADTRGGAWFGCWLDGCDERKKVRKRPWLARQAGRSTFMTDETHHTLLSLHIHNKRR